MTNSPGYTASYFYRRFAADLREVIARGAETPEVFVWASERAITQQSGTVMKVNIQEALDRLQYCPICGENLHTPADTTLLRACDEHGDFSVQDVYLNGEVGYQFIAVVEEGGNAPEAESHDAG